MNELIKIEQRNGIETVSARDLWTNLESKRQFSDWIKDKLDIFEENKDFILHKNVKVQKEGNREVTRPVIEYYLTIETAKHIAMMEKNEQGRKIRQYFIDVEEKAKNALLLKPVNQFDMMRQQIQMLEDQEKRLSIVEKKLETSQMDFYTIAAYASLRGKKVDLTHANLLGRKGRKLSDENGYDVGKINDPRFGTVNTYHTDILSIVFSTK